MTSDSDFLSRAITLAREGMRRNAGGPFGAVVVKEGRIVGEGCNEVTSTHDPTAHAEIVAIRNACHTLGTFILNSCVLYASCEPCPMCLGAIYWARLDAVHYAATRDDAARAGFDDAFIYQDMPKVPEERAVSFVSHDNAKASELFTEWGSKEDTVPY